MRADSVVIFLGLALLFAMDCAWTQEPEESMPYFIKLDPICNIEPVKILHTIVATVLDRNGRPLPGVKVKWMLVPGMAVIVDQDDSDSVEKMANDYAVTYTDEGPVTMTNGTDTPNDDIHLTAGQTWIVITSPREGESHIIAFCPQIANTTRATAFAINYWKDGQITWPENAITRMGMEHTFKFSLVKDSTGAPLPGYFVRWTLVEDESAPGAYLGSVTDTTVWETETDEAGNASATINQPEPEEGINKVKIELRCPTGEILAIREVTQQWVSGPHNIRFTCPEEGIIHEDVVFEITVDNPGEPVTAAVIKYTIPDEFDYVAGDPRPDKIEEHTLEWDIGVFPAGSKRKITLTLRPRKVGMVATHVVVSCRELPPITAGAVITINAPGLYIIKEGPVEVRLGEMAKYRLVIKNAGTAVARNVVVRDAIPSGLQSSDKKTPITFKWTFDTLFPGEEKRIAYAIEPSQAGRFTSVAKVFIHDRLQHKCPFTTTVIPLKSPSQWNLLRPKAR